MRHYEFLSEDELFEINMSPGNLQKLVKTIPGALVGLEFEMIVPGASINDDDDTENDYGADERCRSFSDIESFFEGGEGINHRRDVRDLIDDLTEKYNEYATEQRWEQFNDNGFDDFVEYAEDYFDEDEAVDRATEEIPEKNPELSQDSDKFTELLHERVEELKQEWLQSEWDSRGRLFDGAREVWEESADWPGEDDFLDDNGFRYMSDLETLAHRHDVYWPYHISNTQSNIEDFADSFGSAVGRPVQYAGGYHSINRSNQARDKFYILEPDGSLEADESDSTGLEFVSPPLPVDEMMSEIKKVAQWAKVHGAYTGKDNNTGLHMNISVPDFSLEKLDYVKLVLLLGDKHILESFDRIGNTYAKSSFDLLSKRLRDNPEMANQAMETMKSHFGLAASKAMHAGSTQKYTSINVKDNRVEFRGPGNDYLGMFEQNPSKLLAPMMRMVVALDAACDPEKYRDEYQKKLYKFLSNVVPQKDALEIFVQYSAGKGMPKSAFKSFLKQRRVERGGKLPAADTSVGVTATLHGRPSNPDGNYLLYTRVDDRHTPLYRFMAANTDDALLVLNQWRDEYGDDPRVYIVRDGTNVYGQPRGIAPSTSAVSTPQTQQQTQQSAGRNYVIFRDMNHDDVVATFIAADDRAAMERLERYRREHPGAKYNASRAPSQSKAQTTSDDSEGQRQQPVQQTTQQATPQLSNWEVYNHDDVNTVVHRFDNYSATRVAELLPNIERVLNLPRGSLRVRIV